MATPGGKQPHARIGPNPPPTFGHKFPLAPWKHQGHYTEGAELIDSVLDVVRCSGYTSLCWCFWRQPPHRGGWCQLFSLFLNTRRSCGLVSMPIGRASSRWFDRIHLIPWVSGVWWWTGSVLVALELVTLQFRQVYFRISSHGFTCHFLYRTPNAFVTGFI